MSATMSEQWIAALYASRQERRTHPEGYFDQCRRWYPSVREDVDGFTRRIRSPSAAWPYSYMIAARTKKHCVRLIDAAVTGADVPADVWDVCPVRGRFAPGTHTGVILDYILDGCPLGV